MKPQLKHEAEVRPPHDSHEKAQKARSENAPHLSTDGVNPAAWVGEGGEGIDQGSAGALPYQE